MGNLETYKEKYIDFLIRIKGATKDYGTVAHYRLKKLIEFLEKKGARDIAEVDRQHLEDYQKLLMTSKDYTKHTVVDMLSMVVCFFRYLYDYGHINENPALIIDTPRPERRIPRDIMNEEEIRFLLALPNKDDLYGMRDICIMKLLYGSAMRPIEIFNLKLEDIDFRLKQALVRRPKNRRDRIVHFDRYTAECLTNYIKKARPWLLRGRPLDYLFIGPKAGKFYSGAFAQHFRRFYGPAMKEKFKKDITPYAFRHTSATQWLDSGARQRRDVLPYIQRQLGHESLESTAIYTRVGIEPLRQMFKQYHPRELRLKKLHQVPSPNDIISRLKDDQK